MKCCPEILSLVPAPGWSVRHRTADGKQADLPMIGWALCSVASGTGTMNEVYPMVPVTGEGGFMHVEPLDPANLAGGDTIELFHNGEIIESSPQKFRQLALL